MTLIDAHCHLDAPALAARLPEVIARARAADVVAVVCCGCDETGWPRVRELARRYPDFILPSFGLHPCYVAQRTAVWLTILERYVEEIPSGVGEIGLDRAIPDRSDEAQEAVFVAQLRLARRLRRPVSLHCRRAWGRMLALLQAEGPFEAGGMVHSYSGSAETIPFLEEMGLCVSFSGAITRGHNRRGRRAAVAVATDRLLVETDSPDLMPQGVVGACNEPANLTCVVETLAAIRQESAAALAERTTGNARRVFAGGLRY